MRLPAALYFSLLTAIAVAAAIKAAIVGHPWIFLYASVGTVYFGFMAYDAFISRDRSR